MTLQRVVSARGAANAAFRAVLLLAPIPALVFAAACASFGGLWLLGLVPAAAALAATAAAVGKMAPGQLGPAAAQASTVLALVTLLGFGILPRLGLYRTETVLSVSMRPTFAPGDVIVVTPEPAADVRAGQVISYRVPVGDHHVISHRIVKVVSGGLHPVVITKGDANAVPDPWHARLLGPTAWRYRATLPGLGWPIAILRQPLLHLLLLYGATSLFALLLLAKVWLPELKPARELGRRLRDAAT